MSYSCQKVEKFWFIITIFGKDRDKLKVRNAKIGGFINELSEDDILFCNKEMKLLNSYYNYKI